MGTYNGLPASVTASDSSGNIAAYMMAMAPIRNNTYPHKGSQILDGTTTAHDWIGFYEAKDLPKGMNGEKGYYGAANNRIVPEHCALDIGATQVSTGRAQRIDEWISNKIEKGEKITKQDMIDLQYDHVSVIARDSVEKIAKIAMS